MNLFPHQEKMLEFHITHQNSMDLSEVGTGKTAPAILWLRSVIAAHQVHKALVIVPMTIIANWVREIGMWSELTCVALVGPKDKRLKLLSESDLRNVDVYLINYEGVRTIFAELVAARFEAIICDEGHRIKSYKGSAKTPTNAFLVRELGKAKRFRKILTGTILTNDIEDVWSIAQFVNPKIFNTNHWGFRSRYMYNANAMKPWMSFPDWKPRAGAIEEIHKLLEPYAIRFEKREVLKFLPPVLFQRRNVELSDEQRKAYNELKKHFIAELNLDICRCGHASSKHWGTSPNTTTVCQEVPCNCLEFDPATEQLAALQILGRVNKLLQICSGFAYRHETDEPAYHFKQNAKLAELKEVLEEIGNQRVIIWTAFKEEVEIIREFIIKHRRDKVLEVPLGYQITGDTPQRDRQPIVDAFNRNQCQYLICHPACAGEGLTILAPYAVYYSRGWKLGERLQSLGRNDRPGSEQFDNLTVIDLVCPGTVDDEVMKALSDKKDLLDTINPRSFKEMMK